MNIDSIRTYTFVVELDGCKGKWGGTIVARSFEEVQQLVPNAKEIGELIETLPVGRICSICAGDMVIAEPVPEPVNDEWTEVFE